MTESSFTVITTSRISSFASTDANSSIRSRPMRVVKPQLELPRWHSGDWGIDRPILGRNGSRFFFVWPGHSYWSGTTNPNAYHKTSFVIFDSAFSNAWRTVWEGRFSQPKLKEHSQLIAKFFGVTEDEVRQMTRNATIIWDGRNDTFCGCREVQK